MNASLALAPAPSAALSGRTLWHLMLGGAAGLGFWEFFAAVPTPVVVGFSLEPPELVKSLFQHQLGLDIGIIFARFLHFMTGILFYPLAYWVLSRFVLRFGTHANGWIWGVLTYFIALGLLAPLAGQRFLLADVPLLSLMSLIGHAIYGWLAVLVFDRFEQRA